LAQVIPNLLLWNIKFVREISWSDEVGHKTRLPSAAKARAYTSGGVPVPRLWHTHRLQVMIIVNWNAIGTERLIPFTYGVRQLG
jgi:hypothetical protein